MPDWLTETSEGCVLSVRVIPRAGRTEIAGERAGALLVRIAAAPVEGAANDALLSLLARRLDAPRRVLSVLAGERSRSKRIGLSGFSAADVARRLGSFTPARLPRPSEPEEPS